MKHVRSTVCLRCCFILGMILIALSPRGLLAQQQEVSQSDAINNLLKFEGVGQESSKPTISEGMKIFEKLIEERQEMPSVILSLRITNPVAKGAMANYSGLTRVYHVWSNVNNGNYKAVVSWETDNGKWVAQFLDGPDGTTLDRGDWAPTIRHFNPSEDARSIERYRFDPRQIGLQVYPASSSGRTLENALWWLRTGSPMVTRGADDHGNEIVTIVNHPRESQRVEANIDVSNIPFVKSLVLTHPDSSYFASVECSDYRPVPFGKKSQFMLPFRVDYKEGSDGDITRHERMEIVFLELLKEIPDAEFRVASLNISPERRVIVDGNRASVLKDGSFHTVSGEYRLDATGKRYINQRAGASEELGVSSDPFQVSRLQWLLLINLGLAVFALAFVFLRSRSGSSS